LRPYEILWLFRPAADALESNQRCKAIDAWLSDRLGADASVTVVWDERPTSFPVDGDRQGLYLHTTAMLPTGWVQQVQRMAEHRFHDDGLHRLMVRRAKG